MGQLEVQDGAPNPKAVGADSTAGKRTPIPSTGTPPDLPGDGGGASAVPKDTTKRGAPSSTGSADKLDASHKVD